MSRDAICFASPLLILQDSDAVLQTFITVFKEDVTSTHSQTLVRLIARMIKERKFQVHPNVLSCLLHLRLRTELDQMREGKGKNKANGQPEVKGKFKSEIRKKWATKNQRKREKELKEVQKEMAEAEAEVDKEERAVTVRPKGILADVQLTPRSKQRF